MTASARAILDAVSGRQWQPPANGTDNYTAANNLNQYPSISSGIVPTPRVLGYDANGNLTSGNINGDGTWTFGYDAENRLLTASKTTGGTVSAAYAYDPLGRRIKKSGTGVTTTYFLSDGTDEIAEYDSTKVITTRTIPGPAIDEPIAMENAATGAKTYFHTNRQGSVIAMSGDSAAKTEGPYIYDAYGNCFSGAAPCSSSGEPYRFTGRRFAAETGLSYYRARYHWPKGGRFLQTDPVGYSADLNLYTYVGNDPTDMTDPTGMDSACASTGTRFPQTSTGGSGDSTIPCGSTAPASNGSRANGGSGSKGHQSGASQSQAAASSNSGASGGGVGGGGGSGWGDPSGDALQDPLIDPIDVLTGALFSKGAATIGASIIFSAGKVGTKILVRDAAGAVLEIGEHAAARATQRNISVDVIRRAVDNPPFRYFHEGAWKTGYYDASSKVFVGAVNGKITTVIGRASPKYIYNLQAARP